MADVLVRRPPSPHRTPKIQRLNKFEANTDFQLVIRNRLRQIMKSCNLGNFTLSDFFNLTFLSLHYRLYPSKYGVFCYEKFKEH